MTGTPLEQVPGPYEDTTCQMVAAYGRQNHPHLETVRRFRDEILKRNRAGRRLVELYYATAPRAAALTSRNEVMRTLVLYSFAVPAYLFSRAVLAVAEK